MTKQEQLQRPFEKEVIKYRAASSGVTPGGKPWVKVLAYIDARHVEIRLDEVFGWENWQPDYKQIEFLDNKGIKKTGFLCTIEVDYEGKKIKKTNGADLTDYESFKGGISDSFKRAAAHGYGIGRELYDMKEKFVEVSEKRDKYFTERIKIKNGDKSKVFYWALPGAKKNSNTTTEQPTTEQKKQYTTEIVGTGKTAVVTNTGTKAHKPLTDKQTNRLYAIGSGVGYNREEVRYLIDEKYQGIKSVKDLSKEQYDYICDLLETYPKVMDKDDKKELKDLSNLAGANDENIKQTILKLYGKKETRKVTKEEYKDLKAKLQKRINNNASGSDLPVTSQKYATPAL